MAQLAQPSAVGGPSSAQISAKWSSTWFRGHLAVTCDHSPERHALALSTSTEGGTSSGSASNN